MSKALFTAGVLFLGVLFLSESILVGNHHCTVLLSSLGVFFMVWLFLQHGQLRSSERFKARGGLACNVNWLGHVWSCLEGHSASPETLYQTWRCIKPDRADRDRAWHSDTLRCQKPKKIQTQLQKKTMQSQGRQGYSVLLFFLFLISAAPCFRWLQPSSPCLYTGYGLAALEAAVKQLLCSVLLRITRCPSAPFFPYCSLPKIPS